MLRSAAPTHVSSSKRVTFQSLGLDRAMAEDDDLALEQNNDNARRASCGTGAATRVVSSR